MEQDLRFIEFEGRRLAYATYGEGPPMVIGRYETLELADPDFAPVYEGVLGELKPEAVPLVDATKFATGCPLIFTGAVRTSETKTATSGRLEASRWSDTSHSRQLLPLS